MRNSGRSAGRMRSGWRAALCGAVGAALAGCVDDLAAPDPSQTGAASVPALWPAAAAGSDVDPSLVPDPDSFAAEVTPVWDGLPTIGGVWIAHPLADRARRVRLSNLETGVQVDGAMFRRDPNRDGPAVAISSEAADKLGLQPDAATPVAIVALARVEGVEGAAVPEPEAAGSAPPAADAPPAPEDPAGGTVAAPAGGTVAVPDDTGEAAGAAADLAPGSIERPAGQPAAFTGPALPGEPRARAAARPGGTAGDEAPGALDSAFAPEAAPEALPRRLAALERPTATTVQAADPPAANRPAADRPAGDGMPFIQAGLFGDPDNAERLVADLRGRGLPAAALAHSAGQRALTRVLVGPFESVAARDAALETVRAIGPADAIPVRK